MAEFDKKVEIDTRFYMFARRIVQDKKFRVRYGSPIVLLFFLESRIVRGHMKDGLNIYEEYYRNNNLACSMSYSYLSEAFDVSVATIKRWIRMLKQDDYLKVGKVYIDKHRKQNVYILGTHDGFSECLFIEEIH